MRITGSTRLELGHLARTAAQARSVFRTPPISMMPSSTYARVRGAQPLLAKAGRHRASSIPDFVIVATAELAGLTGLHLGKGFDLVAELSGQGCERLGLRVIAGARLRG